MKCSFSISNFLEEIYRSFPFYYLHWSLRKAFLSLLAILWNSALKWKYLSFSPLLFISHLFITIWKVSSDNLCLFCISFLWGWSWSLSPIQCHEPPSIVPQLKHRENVILCCCFCYCWWWWISFLFLLDSLKRKPLLLLALSIFHVSQPMGYSKQKRIHPLVEKWKAVFKKMCS